MNQMTIPDMVKGVEPECLQLITAHNAVNWAAEANYAMQLLAANDYALKIAMAKPVSVQNALRNAAAIGVSLNPASKNAYLVPRGGAICLDISYMGLLHLAMSTGSIEWGQSKLVYANDSYENLGIDQAPSHKYNAFGARGELVGA
jgi:recombination protein RecT